MDALLGLIIALVVFVLLIMVVSRSAKTLLFLGIAAVVFLILGTIGLVG